MEYNSKEVLSEWKDMRMRESVKYDSMCWNLNYNVQNKDQYLWKRPHKLFLEYVYKGLGFKQYFRVYNLSEVSPQGYILFFSFLFLSAVLFT